MRLKIMLLAVSVLLLMAGTAYSGDVTGTWVAEMERPKMGPGGPGGGPGGGGMGPQGPMKFTFKLKADGNKVTGTMQGPRGNANDISDGIIDGNKVSFVVKISMMGNEMKMKYDGTLSGDEISFKTTMEGGFGGMGGPPGGGGGQRPERPPLIAKRQK